MHARNLAFDRPINFELLLLIMLFCETISVHYSFFLHFRWLCMLVLEKITNHRFMVFQELLVTASSALMLYILASYYRWAPTLSDLWLVVAFTRAENYVVGEVILLLLISAYQLRKITDFSFLYMISNFGTRQSWPQTNQNKKEICCVFVVI